MKNVDLDREKQQINRKLIEKERNDSMLMQYNYRLNQISHKTKKTKLDTSSEWDDDLTDNNVATTNKTPTSWDATPREGQKSGWDATPREGQKSGWDQTPLKSTPKRSRWDQTPMGGATPSAEQFAQMTPKDQQDVRINQETEYRNRFLSDEDLNNMIPVEGYVVLEPPAGYAPIRTPARKLTATPMPMDSGFNMQESMPDGFGASIPYIPGVEGLNYFKAEDAKHFSKLMDDADVFDLSTEEVKERKIMRLLLKIKNGQPMYRKQALRQITVGARLFGASALFNQILPLMMSPTLEDQERHLLVNYIFIVGESY
jgi:splicing factor 3B subunit 1